MPPAVAVDDVVYLRIVQPGQQRHAPRADTQRLALASVSGQYLHGVGADLSPEADRLVVLPHDQKYRIACRLSQPAQGGIRNLYARVLFNRRRRRLRWHGRVALGSRDAAGKAAFHQRGQQTIHGRPLQTRCAGQGRDAEAGLRAFLQGAQYAEAAPERSRPGVPLAEIRNVHGVYVLV
jgi:hypothetical protein